MKGQLLSADFVVGIAILAVCIGLLVQAAESSQRASNVFLYSSDADLVAQSLISNVSLSLLSVKDFCYGYGNGSGNCASFACSRNTLVSHRFIPCANGPFQTNYCFMEVRACR